jgi:hypothetical protein
MLQKEDIGRLGRQDPNRKPSTKQVVIMDPDVLEEIAAGASALDYETNDFIRAILRWAVQNAEMVTARGRYRFSAERHRGE